MEYPIHNTKQKSKTGFNEIEFYKHSKEVLAAIEDFKKASIRLKEVGLLSSSYRQHELDLFIQRNNHYAKEFKAAIEKYDLKKVD